MMHRDLESGRWHTFTIVEQMANIGSEVFRALNWRKKGNEKYASDANLRALELFDLTLSDSRHKIPLIEVARSRELWLDFFLGENQYNQTARMWEKYFYGFTYLAQKKRI